VLDPSDADLVRSAQKGNVSAIGELYDRYNERIFKYVLIRVSNKRRAEDLTGEVFARMITHLHDYREMGIPFSSWLYRIAFNLVVDYYRKEKNRAPILPAHQAQLATQDDDPVVIVEHRLTVEKLQLALDKLDESQREVIILRFLVGLSLREVAGGLDKTVAAVKSLQHRGLVALRLALVQE
jgi:RNA polymerase sigma-70 factor (ECF subfamily)